MLVFMALPVPLPPHKKGAETGPAQVDDLSLPCNDPRPSISSTLQTVPFLDTTSIKINC